MPKIHIPFPTPWRSPAAGFLLLFYTNKRVKNVYHGLLFMLR
nr:MAG TPA: hypothetical protein [Caudoviricetes sp.]